MPIKKILIAAAIIVPCAAGLGIIYKPVTSHLRPEEPTIEPSRVESNIIEKNPENITKPKSRQNEFGSSAPIPHPFPGIAQSRNELPLENDPFLAESKEEQAWLDRNGFPNSEQLEAYSTANDDTMRQAAASGDEIARVILDERLLTRGDVSAQERLFTAAAEGSSYALSTLAAYMAGSSKGSPEIGYALSRAAEMRGDFRIAPARDAMFASPLTMEQKMQGEREALEIFNDLQNRAGNGRSFVDPRPIGP